MLKYVVSFVLMVTSCSLLAVPVEYSYSGHIDVIYKNGGVSDPYGLGLNELNVGSSFAGSFVLDTELGNADYVDVNAVEGDYGFWGGVYGGGVTLDGLTYDDGDSSGMTVANNTTETPLTYMEDFWADNGVPLDPDEPMDALWLGVYSDDWQWCAMNGLLIQMDFIDYDAGVLSSPDLQESIPETDAWDFVAFSVEQWRHGELEFQAAGVLQAGMATVPEPPAWMTLLMLLFVLPALRTAKVR